MLYHYVAVDSVGKILEADFDADSLDQVLRFLAGKELKPISVKLVSAAKGGRFQFSGKINLSDKVFLTKYLALMLRVGTDLLSAINILIADFDKPAVRNFLLEVRDNLTRGQPFYQVFERHKNIFSPTFINLVKAAETSGNLQGTFEELSESLTREAELRSQIKSALIYPIVLFGMSILIIGFLVMFAIPKIASVFLTTGVQPPVFSRIVFGVGLFLGDHIVSIGASFVSIIVLGVVSYYKTETGRRAFEQVIARAPVVKKIFKELAVQRLASTMSSLMKAGLPIIQTIEVTADTVGFSEFKYALRRVAHEGLAKGLTIGDAFKRETVFPKAVTNLIAISEKAGHLEAVLATLSDFYSTNINSSIKSLVSLLEPALLLMMGILVAIISLAVIIPIYQLTSQF